MRPLQNVLRDYFAGIRAVFGGELTTYTDLMMESREEATERMVDEAVALGANAILNVRVETSNLAANASEIYCTPQDSSTPAPLTRFTPIVSLTHAHCVASVCGA